MQTEEILRLAVKGMKFCENGGTLDDYLDYHLTEAAPRRSISSILFSYYRNKGIINFYIKRFSNSTTNPIIRRVLSVVFTQILYQSAVPSAIIADVAVSFIKKKGGQRASGFVNAMIRQLVNYQDTVSGENKIISEKHRVPPILLQRWKKNFSQEETIRIINAIKTIPPFTFRTVFGEAYPEKKLKCKKIEGVNFLKRFHFFSAEEPGMILNSDMMKEGKIYIQDPAVVLFGELIAEIEARTVLDYCSAPGGKTILLAEIFKNSKIVATDRSLNKLKRVRENIEKCGVKNVEIMNLKAVKNMPDVLFDLVLLDVPCSNTGVIRHRPDVMWNFTAKTLSDIVKLQYEILEDTWSKVKLGGRLIYSTCSIEPEENQQQIKNFIIRHPEFTIEQEHLLLPATLNDGTFVVILKRYN